MNRWGMLPVSIIVDVSCRGIIKYGTPYTVNTTVNSNSWSWLLFELEIGWNEGGRRRERKAGYLLNVLFRGRVNLSQPLLALHCTYFFDREGNNPHGATPPFPKSTTLIVVHKNGK